MAQNNNNTARGFIFDLAAQDSLTGRALDAVLQLESMIYSGDVDEAETILLDLPLADLADEIVG